MTVTTADIVTFVRTNVRDFAQLFLADRAGDGVATVFDLPYVCVDPTTLHVTIDSATPQQLALTTDFTVDDRHGMVQILTTVPGAGVNVFFEGKHYTWFVDEDLVYFANTVIGRLNADPSYVFANTNVGEPRFELAGVGTIIEAFWSLLAETALDVDLRNPEGIDLPVSERYNQIQGILTRYEARYETLSSELNVGIGAIQMFTLRRVSLSTGRLVPVFVEQEINDMATPVQIFPPISIGLTAGETSPTVTPNYLPIFDEGF